MCYCLAIMFLRCHPRTKNGKLHRYWSNGRVLVMPRHTEPAAKQKMILEALRLELPPQPPPRIRDGQLELAVR